MSAASNLDLDLQRMKIGPETPDPTDKQEPTAALYMQRKSPVKATEFTLQPSFFLQYPTMTPTSHSTQRSTSPRGSQHPRGWNITPGRLEPNYNTSSPGDQLASDIGGMTMTTPTRRNGRACSRSPLPHAASPVHGTAVFSPDNLVLFSGGKKHKSKQMKSRNKSKQMKSRNIRKNKRTNKTRRFRK